MLAGGAGASGEVPAPADLGGGLPRRLGLRFAWEERLRLEPRETIKAVGMQPFLVGLRL